MSHLMSAQRGNFHLAGHLRTGGRKKKNRQTPHHDHTMTNGEDENDLLRLDVVDFRPFEAL